jgi:hypothetical protein
MRVKLCPSPLSRGWLLVGALVASRLIVLLLGPQRAGAADSCSLAGVVTWDGGAGTNDWLDGDNWSTNSVPTSSDHACINTAPLGGFVDIGSGSASVASVESTQSITIDSGSLAVNSTTQGSAISTLNLATGTIGGAGTLTVNGTQIERWLREARSTVPPPEERR